MTPPVPAIGLALVDQEISDLKRDAALLRDRVAALETKVHTEHAEAIDELDDRVDEHERKLLRVEETQAQERQENRELLLELKRGNAEILALLRREAEVDRG